MENFPSQEQNNSNKKRHIINHDIHEQIRGNKDDLEKIESFINQDIEWLKEEYENLEMDIAYVEHMEGGNEFVKEYEEEMGKKPSSKEYSQEEIDKLKREIEESREHIKKTEGLLAEFILMHASLQHFNDLFEMLDKKFKDLLFRIEPKNLN